MTTEKLKEQIERIEQWYDLGIGYLLSTRYKTGVVITSAGVRVSLIKQCLALYLYDVLRLDEGEIASLVGFESKHKVQHAILKVRSVREKNDTVFELFYCVITKIIEGVMPLKSSNEFKLMAEKYIFNNPEVIRKRLSADLGVSIWIIDQLRNNLLTAPADKFIKFNRPQAVYSNTQNSRMSVYFE